MHLRHSRVANSIIAAFAILTLGVARPASAEEKTIKGGVPINLATLQPGVTYTDIPNGFARPHLMMDIIKPVSDKPVPAIVFVSGNGWRSIDRAALIPQLSPIAKAGYLVAAIDYRIIGEANFPKPLEDVKTAIRFLRANAKTSTSTRTTSPSGVIPPAAISRRWRQPRARSRTTTATAGPANRARCRRP